VDKRAVVEQGMPINWARQAFSVSETCYRYEARLNTENDDIADWLIRLTDNNRKWVFGHCCLCLRNIKNFGLNHKRTNRIHKWLEFNLRIKPRKCLVRE
jgi:putative transposase